MKEIRRQNTLHAALDQCRWLHLGDPVVLVMNRRKVLCTVTLCSKTSCSFCALPKFKCRYYTGRKMVIQEHTLKRICFVPLEKVVE